MDIKVLDSWLKDYLDTKASPAKIAECLSLCGPSFERIKEFGKDSIYSIEVTTNRVDTASVYGIAREAAAILPRFKIPAKLKEIKPSNKYQFTKSVGYLNADVDSTLCPRFSAVLIRDVKIGESPEIIKNRLESADVRSINNVVDISNYIMLALGQPVHTFDYDKINAAKMKLRESTKGEKITTLDNKTFTLAGGDIVIEDGEKRLIDLAGVMGGNLSAVDVDTKNVLLFVQTYDPIRIRKTSMGLAQRTQAATIFEKGTDTELVTTAILEGIQLLEKYAGGKSEKDILNIYPKPYKTQQLTTNLDFIEKRLGISLSKNDISEILNSLNFECKWTKDELTVTIPSYRSLDIKIQEDIVEEIARLNGYHNLPSVLMEGQIPPVSPMSKKFLFESEVKNILSGWGGVEIYSLSLVPKEYVSTTALKLKNPLGLDTEYLRTTLMPSLITSAKSNRGTFENFHLFEIANVYLPVKNDLPQEELMLGGVFEGYDYREAKGIVEGLLDKLNVSATFDIQENEGFAAGKCVSISSGNIILGKLGYSENGEFIYYELQMDKLHSNINKKQYAEISKYPAQIEDLTVIFPDKTKIGAVTQTIKSTDSLISDVELKDVYNDAFTFRIWYQDKQKTLTDADVEKIRNKVLTNLKSKFGGSHKS